LFHVIISHSTFAQVQPDNVITADSQLEHARVGRGDEPLEQSCNPASNTRCLTADPQTVAKELIAAAVKAGSTDDITIQLLKL
jgi:serine/threonine protein phosphatase PrpC